MERTPGTVALFEQARDLAATLGFTLEEPPPAAARTETSFPPSASDGMGAIGQGAHAENESIRIDALASRTALLAAMIATTV